MKIMVDYYIGRCDMFKKIKKFLRNTFDQDSDFKELENEIIDDMPKTEFKKEPQFKRLLSPKCPNCDEGSMYEVVYSHEVHQEMYWCPKCGTINIEVDAEPIWLIPVLVQERMEKEQQKIIQIEDVRHDKASNRGKNRHKHA